MRLSDAQLTSLDAVVLQWRQSLAEIDDVADAFLDATVYCVRTADDQAPGIFVSGSDDRPAACVFTSLSRLAEAVARRPGTPREWLSTTGADLMTVLPAGVGVVVDPISATPVMLPHALVGERIALREERPGG